MAKAYTIVQNMLNNGVDVKKACCHTLQQFTGTQQLAGKNQGIWFYLYILNSNSKSLHLISQIGIFTVIVVFKKIFV